MKLYSGLEKKKEITQEELGNFTEVSTVAVWKWGNRNFYPAIKKCEECILRYKNSCFLKLKMASLFLIYLWKTNDEERSKKTKTNIITKLKKLKERGVSLG